MDACSSFTSSITSEKHATVMPIKNNSKSNNSINKHDVEASFAVSPKLQSGMIMRQESFKRAFSFIEPAKVETSGIPASKFEENLLSNNKQRKISTPSQFATSKKEVIQEQKSQKRSQETLIVEDETRRVAIAQLVARHVSQFEGIVEPDSLLKNPRVPSILFEKYVERLIRQFNKWAEENDGPNSIGVRCAVLAFEYLKRANLIINAYTIHRCFLGAYLVAIKLLYDYYMSNSFWASVGGVTAKEINDIEIAFCQALRWNFNVIPSAHEQELEYFKNSSF